MLIRAQEMARYVADGVLDGGLTGQDWIVEHLAGASNRESSLVALADLVYAKQSLARSAGFSRTGRIAVSAASGSRGRHYRHRARGDAGLFRQAQRDRERGVLVGATEVKPPTLADAIVEVTETGSSLRANRLRIIDTVLESNTQLIANAGAMADEWTKLENIALLLKAAIEAQGRVGIMLNVRAHDLEAVLQLLPALQRPTISPLSDREWVAVNTIIEERTVRI